MFHSILQPAPYDIQVVDSEEGREVVVAIAADQGPNRIVSVVCELCPFAWKEGEEAYEFSFSIVVVSLDGTHEPFETQDRNQAAGFIPDDVRPKVMDVVCRSFRVLAEDAGHPRIYWVTKDRNIQEGKAMRKYDMLINTLEEMGYFIEETGTDAFDRSFWAMRR